MKIVQTLSIAEMQLLRRLFQDKNTDGLFLAGILQDCSDLSPEEIFKLDMEQVRDIFSQLFDKSLSQVQAISQEKC